MLSTRIFSFTMALTLITSGAAQAHDTSILKNVTDTAGTMSAVYKACTSKKALICAFVLFAAGYIRLATKSSPKTKVTRNWQEYFTKLASLLNVTQIGTSEYWNTADQLIIGDQFKLIDKSIKDKDDEGRDVTFKKKAVEVSPSGMLGYFDAYILKNLKTIFEHLENLVKLNGYLDGSTLSEACE